jgi:hypothetical protein
MRTVPLPDLIDALAPLGADVAPIARVRKHLRPVPSVAQSGLVPGACQLVATSLLVGMLHFAMIKSVFLTIGAG